MRRVPYSQVLQATSALAVAELNAGVEEDAVLRLWINRALHTVWRLAWWPELTPSEPRFFRPPFDNATNYTASTETQPTEVYNAVDDTYYQLLANVDGETNLSPDISAVWTPCQSTYSGEVWTVRDYVAGDVVRGRSTGRYFQAWTTPVTQPDPEVDPIGTGWGILTEFQPTIRFDEQDCTPIDAVRYVYTDDPARSATAVRLNFEPHPDGIRVLDAPTNQVWVTFRRQPPRLLGNEWSAATAYVVGDTVYASDRGDYYQCVYPHTNHVVTDPVYWVRLDFPALFEHVVPEMAAAVFGASDGDAVDRQSLLISTARRLLRDELRALESASQHRPMILKA